MQKKGQIFEKLVETIEFLRSEKGCPWDKKQTIKDIKTYLLEEVYELCDAIDRNDIENISEEIGDVILNLFMIANILNEKGLSNIYEIAENLREKIIKRHPHVFGDKTAVDAQDALKKWHQSKKENEKKGVFKEIPLSAPPLEKAYLISKRADKIGFGFEKQEDIINKLQEELKELISALKHNNKEVEEETGDLFFTLVNLAVYKGFVPQDALNTTCNKFLKRMQFIETKLDSENKSFLTEKRSYLEKLWEEAKKREN